jgi:hypothetical protein
MSEQSDQRQLAAVESKGWKVTEIISPTGPCMRECYLVGILKLSKAGIMARLDFLELVGLPHISIKVFREEKEKESL